MQSKTPASEFAKEIKTLAAAFVAAAIIIKIAYYKEGITDAIRTTASLFWLFVIPGYAITFHWKDNLGLVERLAAGTVIAMAIGSIASYYLGIAGLKIQHQTILLPAAIIVISLIICLIPWAGKRLQPQQERKPQQ